MEAVNVSVWYNTYMYYHPVECFHRQLKCALMSVFGTTHTRTTSYHPVERFHRQLMCALKAQPSTMLWTEYLPLVLLGI